MGISKAEPGSKVLGHSILITLGALELYGAFGKQILAQVGLKDVKKDDWYDMQKYCDFLGALMERVGPATLFVADRNIGLNAELPPIFDTPQLLTQTISSAASAMALSAGLPRAPWW